MQAPIYESGKFYRLNTADGPQARAFDHWRDVHSNLALELHDPQGSRFRGERLECVGEDGVRFGKATSSNVSARFGSSLPDYALISGTLRGAIHARFGHDGVSTFTPASGLTFLDSRRPTHTTTINKHSHLYLVLPSEMVSDFSNKSALNRDDGPTALVAAGLFPFLWSHMQMLSERGETLDRHGAIAALNVARNLALAGLQQLCGPAPEDGVATHTLFCAARHFIDSHPGALTAGAIAAALGCSRAHLYRVFAAHDMAVGDCVRSAHFTKAAHRLTHGQSIARIAWDCGYSDTASFSRAFKHQFGVSPGEYRARVCAAMAETKHQKV